MSAEGDVGAHLPCCQYKDGHLIEHNEDEPPPRSRSHHSHRPPHRRSRLHSAGTQRPQARRLPSTSRFLLSSAAFFSAASRSSWAYNAALIASRAPSSQTPLPTLTRNASCFDSNAAASTAAERPSWVPPSASGASSFDSDTAALPAAQQRSSTRIRVWACAGVDDELLPRIARLAATAAGHCALPCGAPTASACGEARDEPLRPGDALRPGVVRQRRPQLDEGEHPGYAEHSAAPAVARDGVLPEAVGGEDGDPRTAGGSGSRRGRWTRRRRGRRWE